MTTSQIFSASECTYKNSLKSNALVAEGGDVANTRLLVSPAANGGDGGVRIPDEFTHRRVKVTWHFSVVRGHVRACVDERQSNGHERPLFTSPERWPGTGEGYWPEERNVNNPYSYSAVVEIPHKDEGLKYAVLRIEPNSEARLYEVKLEKV